MKQWLTNLLRRQQRHADPGAGPAGADPAQPKTQSQPPHPPASYATDQPIDSIDADRFGRWPFAKRIGDTLAKRVEPSSLVIGLYGPWGDGKTSVLRLMEVGLKDHAHVVVIRFNPWNFGSEQQLLRGFFATLADGLGRSLATRKEEIGRVLENYGSILTLASMSLAAGAIEINAGEAVQGLGKALSSVELDELRSRLEQLLRESGKRLVVLIDDIDRLDRAEAHAILKLVKLSAGFDHTSYVLAFDDEVVAAAIGERYGAGDLAAGRRFLEKIVQVPLRLPPPDQIELRKMVFDGVGDALALASITLTQAQIDEFIRHFIDGLEPQLKTPRQANLYRNALTFALPLLKDETHPVDALLIEGIRVFYPRLHTTIRDNEERFLRAPDDGRRGGEARQRLEALIADAMQDAGPKEKDGVTGRLLPALFPRISTMGYGAEWDLTWSRDRRIASSQYFRRYFTYSVPPRDVSDAQVAELIDKLRTGALAAPDADAALQAITQRGAAANLIRKLRHQEEKLDGAAAGPLALLIARNGSQYPNPRALFSHAEPFAQAAILTAHLLRCLRDADEREALAYELVAAAEPLPFAFEYFQWLRHGPDAPEEKRTLPADVETKVGRRLMERIRTKAHDAPLYRQYGDAAPALYWAWRTYGDGAELTAHLRKSLALGPDEVDEFLDGFVGYGWGMESRLPSRSDFERGSYDAVAASIDPALVYAMLRERYGPALDQAGFHHSDDVPIAKRIAFQFAYIHRRLTTNPETGPDEDRVHIT